MGVLLQQNVRAADDKRNFLVHTDDRNTTVPLGEHMGTAEEAAVKEETANNRAEQCMAGTKKIYHDAIYAACFDTAGAEVDDDGDGCDVYIDCVCGCGYTNTDSFQSEEMCCACGGGGRETLLTAPTLIEAMEDAIAGVISSQDPVQCMSRYGTSSIEYLECCIFIFSRRFRFFRYFNTVICLGIPTHVPMIMINKRIRNFKKFVHRTRSRVKLWYLILEFIVTAI